MSEFFWAVFLVDSLALKDQKWGVSSLRAHSEPAQKVFVSNSAENRGAATAMGEGNEAVTFIDCKNTKGRYLRIVQTGSTDVWYWSIQKMKVEAE